MLNDIYVPNRASHYEKWGPSNIPFEKSRAFTCSMDESLVEKIMMLEDVKSIWKLLVMVLGIKNG